MSDDPFAEPSDSEATIIRPRPGGRTSAPAPTQAAPVRPAESEPVPMVGVNPLLAAAAPLLAAIVRLGTAKDRFDPDRLRRSMVEAVRLFEQRALATGLDTRSLRAARYALCATVDDLVLSTPRGSTGSWAAQTLTSIFHNEVSGGERFFDILEQMQKDLGRHHEVVELMYLCASLGFEGRYRVMPRGIAALAELRDSVYRGLRQRRGEFERDLSPQWRGRDTGYKPAVQRIPLWILGLSTAGIVGLIYLFFNFSLAAASDVTFTELAGLPPHGAIAIPRVVTAALPPPPAPQPIPAAQAVAPDIRGFLAPEIKARLVEVFEDLQSVTVRLTNRSMFGSGSADLNSSYVPLLKRIATALNTRKGNVLVNGYTDNQPIHTVRFPSNWQLSQARANAVADVLKSGLSDSARVRAVGKGDADPIASNGTAEGRQENRRTEVVLLKTSSLP